MNKRNPYLCKKCPDILEICDLSMEDKKGFCDSCWEKENNEKSKRAPRRDVTIDWFENAVFGSNWKIKREFLKSRKDKQLHYDHLRLNNCFRDRKPPTYAYTIYFEDENGIIKIHEDDRMICCDCVEDWVLNCEE